LDLSKKLPSLLWQDDCGTTYNRKFDMKTAIFLKIDKVKQVKNNFSLPTVPIKA
jgi:hypothetical protein